MVAFSNSISGIERDQDHVIATTAKVMVNGDTLFTAFGDVQVTSLWSECITANDTTASTLLYRIVPTIGTSTNICTASATLASAAAGTIVVLPGDAFATAATIATTGVSLNTTARGTIFADGTLRITVGVGSTTGTWRHYLRYEPLEPGAYVMPAF